MQQPKTKQCSTDQVTSHENKLYVKCTECYIVHLRHKLVSRA